MKIFFYELFFVTFFLFVAIDSGFGAEILENILKMPYTEPFEPQIEGFSDYGGKWSVDDEGTISVDSGSGPKLVCDSSELQDIEEGEISVEIFCPGNKNDTNAGILIKVRKPGIGADNFIGYEIAVRPESKEINLGKHRFNYGHIGQYKCEIKTDTWIKLNVRFSANWFEVYIDEKFVVRHEDAESPLISGGIALRPWQREAKYRNLKIKSGKDGDWQNLPFKRIESHEKEYPDSLSVKNIPPLLVLLRHPLRQPSAVGQDLMQGQFAPDCEIREIRPSEPETPVRTIFSDPGGNIYDMNLSLDAKTIYFSHKKHEEKNYSLWKIGVDGKGLERLTDGSSCDVSPCEIPGGDLIFVSTRRYGHTVCQPGPASNLYRLFRSGKNEGKIFCISMNTLSDMSPQLLPDGRIMFTRWEYIDRDLTFRQSLWTQRPDGTAYQLFFGNTIRDVGTFWQARQIPGEPNRVLATFAPHHNYPHGAIGIIDRNFGIEGPKGLAFKYVTREIKHVGDTNFPWGYRDPFPLGKDRFLCAYGNSDGYFKNGNKRFKIYLLDSKGSKRLIYEDRSLSCAYPIPIVPFESVPLGDSDAEFFDEAILENADENVPMGTLLLVDVEEGLQGKVAPGTIKSLRIMEQVRKTADIGHRAYDQSPVMSYGTYYAKRDWGTVQLEPDGSVHFHAPALREIYLQALDSEGREVQRMTSALQLMPNEHLSCNGCHESRDATPIRNKVPIAAMKAPQTPVSPKWLTDRKRLNPEPDARVFDYPSTVQPILDKHCTSCHEGTDPAGGYDLSGDRTRFFNMSYDNLLGRSRSYRQHDMEHGQMLPEEATKGKPLVHFYWLLWTPSAVNEPYWTGSHASRLTEIIESDHYGIEMPLEDRQIIYYWIDANVPYYGTYAHARPGSAGRRDRFADPENGRQRAWFAREFKEVFARRCTECHNNFEPPNYDWIGRNAWINLSRPENSAALTAHLEKEKDGRGIRMNETTPFFSKDDPDYRKMLQAIQKGRQDMQTHPEADTPGFKQFRKEP